MKKGIVTLGTILVLLISLVLPVYAIDVPESVDTYYYDPANVLSEDVEYEISEKNYNMDRHSGAYIEVVAVDYIHSDILNYAYTMFNEWGIGSAEKNNGILLLAVIQEEKYYVMVGRGLESHISAARIDEILETYFEPHFDQEKYETAIVSTFNVLYEELVDIYGMPKNQVSTEPTSGGINVAMILFWVILIIFIIMIISIATARPRRPRVYTHRYRTPTYRTRPYYAPRPIPVRRTTTSYRPSTSSRPTRSTFTPSRSSGVSGGSSRSSIGSRSRGGSSRGFGGGRR